MEAKEKTKMKLLSMKEAADYLKISYTTLSRMRRRGNGPPYIMVGKNVRFPLEMLEEWLKEKIVHHKNIPS